MKAKDFLKNLLLVVLILVTIWVIAPQITDIYDEIISYTNALQLIEEDESDIKKIVVNSKKNEVTMYLKDSKSEKKVVMVPDSKEFVEYAMKVKKQSNANFEVIVARSMSSFVWDFVKLIFAYWIIQKFWKSIFNCFGKKKQKETDENEKSNISENLFKSIPGLSTNVDKGKGNNSFTKMFSSDYTDEIKEHIVKNVTTNFDDVAGMENAKTAMKDVALGIVNAKIYEENGAKIPSGILLEGEPGTGKTLLARALAGEIKVPFFQYSATEMSSKWVGESEEKVRQIFSYAKEHSPCIIFFDEIDSIATSRKSGMSSHDKKLLNQLLTSLDGFNPRDGVIFIAATNFAESLDEAIKRPGRFDRIVHVDLPDENEREAILKVHARNKKLSSDINFKELAKNTATLSGAVLANILNEAAILQIKNDHNFITLEDLEEAHRNVLFGYASKRKLKDCEKHLTAVHELGHAVVSGETIKEISILPRGSMGGYTWYTHEEESYATANKIKKTIVSLLGGRAAEQIILGEVSTGAQNDMERAYEVAYNYVTKYGMSENIGPVSIKNADTMSEESKEEIWNEVKKMISEAFEEAKKIVENKKKTIEYIANVLEEKETIRGEEYYLLSSKEFI